MRFIAILLGLCLLSPLFSLGQNSASYQVNQQFFQLPDGLGQGDYVPGVLVVRVNELYHDLCSPTGIHVPGLEKYLDALEVSAVGKSFPNTLPPSEPYDALGRKMVDLSPIYELQYKANAGIEDAVNFLWSSGLFDYVEPLYIYQPMYDPADPDTGSQYYLDLVRARDAWDLSKGDTSIVIGIIDTGTSFSHPELVNKQHYNLNDPIDGIDNDNDGYVDNYRGWDVGGDFWLSTGDNDPSWGGSGPAIDHGVLVSGPAGAENDNNVNIASLGFNCRLMQVKVSIDNSPQIYRGYQGVVYAADHGAHILNLSWGGTGVSRMGEEAIQYAAINKNCLVVASAGNTPADLAFYPASYDNVLSVAGSQQNDAFWNSTPTFGTTYNYLVDLTAPSRDITTIRLNAGTFSATGTSLGSPIVCGVAGLVKAIYPSYTNEQVGQRVRVTSDPAIYSLNAGIYTEKMGRGRVDAYKALTDTTPSIRVLDYEFTDPNDGIIQAGDTIDFRARFINYLDPATNVSVTISSPDIIDLTAIHGNVDLGDMGTMEVVSHRLAPLQLKVSGSTQPGSILRVRIEYTANGYTDYEYLHLYVEPDYVNLDANRLETSMNGEGRWGYMNFPQLNIGKGLTIDAVRGLMNDAGFLVGTSATQLADNFENQNGSQNNDFQNVSPIYRSEPGTYADQEIYTTYDDGGAGSGSLGVVVSQNSYQFELEPDNNYFIQEYTITNSSSTTPLTDVYAGMYFDMDGYWRTNNVSRYDTMSRCIYNFTETWVTLWNMGIALLTPDSLHGFAADVTNFGYTKAEKWTALTSPPSSAEVANTNVIQFTSTGPFTIPAGQSHTVAFAVLIADSVPQLRTTVERAKDKYFCVIKGGMSPQVDLGADILHCNGDTNFVLDAGGGYTSYLWDDGSTAQSRTIDSSGTYWVKVTDANGCEDYDQVNVTIGNGFNGGFTCNPVQAYIGDPITFTDTTQGVTEWGWNFNDGSSVCPASQVTTHSFSSFGNYNVELYISNGVCTDTITKTVMVDTLVGITAEIPTARLEVYPNPATDAFHYRFNSPTRGNYQLVIRNSLGQEIHRLEGEKSIEEIDEVVGMQGIVPGVYFVEFQIGDLRIGRSLVLK